MKLKASTLIWTFVWCLFMGVTAISIGFGALFPSMNRIAKPFVCPAGKMDVDEQVYNPYPGKTVTTLTWYCVDETSGTKTELGIFPMSLYAGMIYGLLLFGVVFVGMVLLANKPQRAANRTSRGGVSQNINVWEQTDEFHNSARLRQDDFASTLSKLKVSENVLARMKELKELRAADLISESEYEEKRAEILKSL